MDKESSQLPESSLSWHRAHQIAVLPYHPFTGSQIINHLIWLTVAYPTTMRCWNYLYSQLFETERLRDEAIRKLKWSQSRQEMQVRMRAPSRSFLGRVLIYTPPAIELFTLYLVLPSGAMNVLAATGALTCAMLGAMVIRDLPWKQHILVSVILSAALLVMGVTASRVYG